MKAELLHMSQQEQWRSEVMRLYVEGYIKQKEAARRMGLSTRQVRRLAREYRKHGSRALIHGNRGKASNRKIREGIKQQALVLVRQHYPDFGPTFAAEKLVDNHGMTVSSETLRQWMIADGLWKPKRKRQPASHPMRERRPRVGELVQIDGSPHDWFEGRAPKCALIVFIDDATSQLLDLQFYPSETTQAYMSSLRRYLNRYGRPVALYSDRHSIFTVNTEDAQSGDLLTQFGRALKTLDIEGIQANSPQAKGRVERANQTLQNRLIKEMRLAGVGSMEEGNAFLAAYMEKHNRKFAIKPASDEDAHRTVVHNEQALDLIFSIHHKRKLSKDLSLQYNNIVYQLQIKGIGYAMRGVIMTVCESFDGTVTLLYKGKDQQYATYKRGEKPQPVADGKTINKIVDHAIIKQTTAHTPRPDHPWRKPFLPTKQNRTFLSGAKPDISTLR
mgnify:CR=1 FL=1